MYVINLATGLNCLTLFLYWSDPCKKGTFGREFLLERLLQNWPVILLKGRMLT